ncbi:hypothetical protein NBRC10512_003242 [Rhodotorula toruloides]
MRRALDVTLLFASPSLPRSLLTGGAVFVVLTPFPFFARSTFRHSSFFSPTTSFALTTGNSSSVSSAHDLSAAFAVDSKSMMGMGRYWVGRSASGVGMCDQIPLVVLDSRKEGAGTSWRRAASVGERGDSATRCMSEVEGAEAPVDGVALVRWSLLEGARSEGENGAFSDSAEVEEPSLTRVSTPYGFAGNFPPSRTAPKSLPP